MKGTKKPPAGLTAGGQGLTTHTNTKTKKDSILDEGKGPPSLLRSALNYARQGFSVFPCEPRGKVPLGFLVPNGHKDATTDLATIRAWWKDSPSANIGMVPRPGMAVLDVDPRNGGSETLEALHLPELETTLRARTGGGGFHLVFDHAPHPLPGKLGKGLDLKANGKGYVVVAPSIHPSGEPYEWVGGFHPEAIQAWPQGLIKPTAPAVSSAAPSELSPSQIKALLARINPDSYETWVAVGQAMKSGDEDLFEVWDEWSSLSEKYPGKKECKKKWQSFRGAGRGIGTLVYLAGGQISRPTPEEEFTAALTEPSTKGFIIFRHISEIVAEKREPTWLLDDVIETKVLGVLAGPRGSFKSFIVLDWSMRVAMQGHGVLILSGEGAGLDRRVDAWVRTHEPALDIKRLPMVALERVLNLNANEVVADLVGAIKACTYPIHLVVIDTLSKYSPGTDENDNTEMAQYLSRLAVKVRDSLGVSVVLVAHSGHSDPSRPRGASVLMANPDVEYIVSRPDPTGMLVTVSRDRFKDTPSLPRLVYMAELVDLGRTDSRLQPVTSLALQPSAEPASKRSPPGGVQKVVFDAACSLAALGVDVDVEQVITESIRRMPYDEGSGKRDQRRGFANTALQALVAKDYLSLEGKKVGVK